MITCVGSRCFSTPTTNLISATLHQKNTTPSAPPSINTQNNGNPGGVQRIRNKATLKSQTTPKKQPSVAEMERAIGAGMFRDRDPSGTGEQKTLFDMLSSTPINQPESEIERKLRETGEWVLEATEGSSRSAGHEILMVVCLRILPVWLLFLLIASGAFKLPFNNSVLDDLIM